MKADPTLRRARNLVVLVVFAVALPSLLLTGLGVIAVTNEEAAARKRLESSFEPAVRDLAYGFNDRVDALVKESVVPLAELARWSQGDGSEPSEALRRFVQTSGFATNYFVIDANGRVLAPGPAASQPRDLSGALAGAIGKGSDRDAKGRTCEGARALLDRLGPQDPDRSLARYALGLCLLANGLAEGEERLAETWAASSDLAESRAARAGAALAAAASNRAKDHRRFLDRANDLADILGAPTRPTPSVLAVLLARFFDPFLHDPQDLPPSGAQERLEAIAGREALFAHMARFAVEENDVPVLQAVRVNGWRRVVLSHSRGGIVAGFELVPSGFAPFLNEALRGLKIDAPITVALLATEPPDCCHEEKESLKKKEEEGMDRVAAWVLLKKTELAWQLVLLLDDKAALARLVQSRSRLYSWGLGLVVVALVAGIAYTVRAVVLEARFSRLKTDFVSSVSHDLRTPLTSIRMFTETLLLGRVSGREQERECLQVIARETERLSRLTERILDFSRMEAGRKAYAFRPEPVPELVGQALAVCRPLMEEAGCRTEIDIPVDLPRVEVDRDAIVESLVNLLSNAIKYSPGEREVRIRARRNGRFAEVSVTDRGMGIPRSEQKRIFEKFYRVDCPRTSEVGGSGLGLSLVRYILDAHRGAVTVESTVGEGSTFTIRLPIESERAEDGPRGEKRNGDDPGSRG